MLDWLVVVCACFLVCRVLHNFLVKLEDQGKKPVQESQEEQPALAAASSWGAKYRMASNANADPAHNPAGDRDATINQDSHTVIPFRSGPVDTPESEQQPDEAEAAKSVAFWRRKPKELKLAPMPAVYAESTDWSIYERPTILRHDPQWMPPEWEPEISDEQMAEMVPEENNVVVPLEDIRAAGYLKGENEFPYPMGAFIRASSGKPLSLHNAKQMELPLTRH